MNRRFAIMLICVLALAMIGPVAWMMATNAPPPHTVPVHTAAPSILIASLNIAMVQDASKIVSELDTVSPVRDADLLFLQEVVRSDKGTSVAQEVANQMHRQVVFASPAEGSTLSGIAILSRTPMATVVTRPLRAQNLVFRSRSRIALAATVDTPIGAIRAVTTHLDTRINPAKRVEQMGPAIEEAASFHGPAVIGGDFNTNDWQWVSNVVPVPFPGWQASRVRVLMESRGFHTPFTVRTATFDHLGMQLDWIYTNTLKPLAHGIVPMAFSDHHAIWVQYTN